MKNLLEKTADGWQCSVCAFPLGSSKGQAEMLMLSHASNHGVTVTLGRGRARSGSGGALEGVGDFLGGVVDVAADLLDGLLGD